MNIDKLTLKQIKEIQALNINGDCKSTGNIYDGYIGKHCICRTRNEGLNFGKVVKADESGVVLEDAIRIWYHRPADKTVSWYEGVANTGVSSDSKISTPVKSKLIAEDYSLTECSELAIKSIKEKAPHGQS